MPFRLSDQRRVQAAFDAVLEDTIYEAELATSPDKMQISALVRDPDQPRLTVCGCVFTFNAHRSQKTRLQPSAEELQQMADSFRQLCDVYVSPPVVPVEPDPPAE